ncbi:MAG: hypothetical protein ACFCU1_05070 [Sumerlaeia bacterium]
MKYWITTHHPTDEVNVVEKIYVSKSQPSYQQEVKINDKVVIYETGKTPDNVKKKGRKGIIAIGIVKSDFYDPRHEKYIAVADVDVQDSKSFIPLDTIPDSLRSSRFYRNSIRELRKDEYEAIKKIFR